MSRARGPPTTPRRVGIAATASPPRTPSKIVDPKILAWQGIPDWEDDRSPFMRLLEPDNVAFLDRICSSSSGLEVQDHLALSGACRAIRSAYTERAWQSILGVLVPDPEDETNPIYMARDRIFTNARDVATLSPAQAAQAAAAFSPGVRFILPGTRQRWSGNEKTIQYSFHDEAVRWVNEPKLTLGEAKKQWKVNDAQLANISWRGITNYHHPQAADIRQYYVAAVRRIALQAHGGATGHEEHVMKLLRTAQKKAANKAAREAAGLS